MHKISAIIVVKGNPPHIFESLNSVDNLVSEIIIGSVDLDENLKYQLQKYKSVKIVILPKETPFADLVKEGMKKYAQYEYILYLDPDEIFAEDTVKFIKKNLTQYDYFQIPRKNIIFGKWISHSRWWPDYQLRLFKRNSVIWPESLHPIPQPKGIGCTFNAEENLAILHYNYDNISQYLEKAQRYAKFEAEVLIERNADYSLNIALKQSISEFISRFFANGGYKDGMHGFTLATLQMLYYLLVYFYYWEKKKYFKLEEKDLIINTKHFSHQFLFETNFWIIKNELLKFFATLKLKIENAVLKLLK